MDQTCTVAASVSEWTCDFPGTVGVSPALEQQRNAPDYTMCGRDARGPRGTFISVFIPQHFPNRIHPYDFLQLRNTGHL
jgi:hypothetical protein